MTDFVESLKDIKKELMKEQKTALSKENSKEFENLAAKENSKKNESVVAKEKRLQAEFVEFVKGEKDLFRKG